MQNKYKFYFHYDLDEMEDPFTHIYMCVTKPQCIKVDI